MYVSRGIGTSFLPIRFLCRPELSIITVVPNRPMESSCQSAGCPGGK
jgi:hypothetical protein